MSKILFTLCISFITYATFSQEKPFESSLIIIGGGTSPKDAEVAKNKYEQQTELNKLIETNIEIVLSDTIKGLNPGFYIAVIGAHTDKNFAQMAANIANRYLSGVYIRQIEEKRSSDFIIPVLRPQDLPFEANRFYCLPGLNEFFLADKTDDGSRLTKIIRHSGYYSDVYVDISKISFTRQIGSMEVRYYMGWLPEEKTVLYISQFQFSKIPEDLKVDLEGKIEWTCKGAGRRLSMGDFNPYEFNETCVYSNAIETSKIRGYEYDNYQVKYPMSQYSFEEVVNYHLGKGHFNQLKEVNYQFGEYSYDGYEIRFFSDTISIEGDDGHSWESLMMKDGFIIYEEGGGA